VKEEFSGISLVSKKKMWEVIAERMTSHGYSYSGTACDDKWRSLNKTYRAKIDSSSRTGRGGGSKWAYFEAIDNIVGKSAASRPISAATCTSSTKKSLSAVMSSTPLATSVSTSTTSVASTSGLSGPLSSSVSNRKRSQPPEWFTTFMTEFKENQEKRHREFMDHLNDVQHEQKKRTDMLKILTEKLIEQ